MVDMKSTQQYIVTRNDKVMGFTIIEDKIDDSDVNNIVLPLLSHPSLEGIDISHYEIRYKNTRYKILKYNKNSNHPYFVAREIISSDVL
jgi:hypothetical protein